MSHTLERHEQEQEQQVGVELDYARQLVTLSVRGKFDIRPTVIALPFIVFDRIQWQRLTVQMQQAGIIPGNAVHSPQGEHSNGGQRQ